MRTEPHKSEAPRSVELPTSELYRIKASAYGAATGLTDRGAQKAFKRMESNNRVAPVSLGAYAGLPVVKFVGDRLFMLEPYFNSIRLTKLLGKGN